MEAATPTSSDDCDALLSEVLPFTERFLEKHGEFYPLGAVMKIGGDIAWYGVAREEEFPKSKAVLADLIEAYRRAVSRGDIKAAIVLYDVKLGGEHNGDTSDAICADCYHRDGLAKRAFFPYRFTDGALVFGEASAQSIENLVFS